jgi:hypothetical protein
LDAVRRIRCFFQAFAVGLVFCFGGTSGALAGPPAGAETGASAAPSSSDASASLPQQGFLSSLKQAFNKNFDREVVRGHFDLGSPPNAHRYYCLVDPKTGNREPNGVLGQPLARADGMTGINGGSVSLYSCDDAEKQRMLVTEGYVVSGRAGGVIAPAPPAQTPTPAQTSAQTQTPTPIPAQVQTSAQTQTQTQTPTQAQSRAQTQLQTPTPTQAVAALPDPSPDKVDVAGVKLGMSPDEVRAVLKSKQLPDYYESTEALGHFDSTKGAMQTMADGRFVNVIATWAPSPSSPSVGAPAEDGESYEVMFTPVPGRERAMAVIHSVGYSSANAVRETALENGLVKKYGGFATPDDLPASPTWRFQRGGNVEVGDPCNRRGLFGGLSGLNTGNAGRQNLALRTTPDEFRFQIDRCGIAIVTEDHSTANRSASREDRIVTRFTVTAYSPSIGFEGATAAAQLMQSAWGAVDKAGVSPAKAPLAPDR